MRWRHGRTTGVGEGGEAAPCCRSEACCRTRAAHWVPQQRYAHTRTHARSGHYTMDGCVTSQFENHVRAVLGWPLGDTSLNCATSIMLNLLGEADGAEGMRLGARGEEVQQGVVCGCAGWGWARRMCHARRCASCCSQHRAAPPAMPGAWLVRALLLPPPPCSARAHGEGVHRAGRECALVRQGGGQEGAQGGCRGWPQRPWEAGAGLLCSSVIACLMQARAWARAGACASSSRRFLRIPPPPHTHTHTRTHRSATSTSAAQAVRRRAGAWRCWTPRRLRHWQSPARAWRRRWGRRRPSRGRRYGRMGVGMRVGACVRVGVRACGRGGQPGGGAGARSMHAPVHAHLCARARAHAPGCRWASSWAQTPTCPP